MWPLSGDDVCRTIFRLYTAILLMSGVITDEDVMDNTQMSTAFNKACIKNVFTVILVLIYLTLSTVAAFLAYQTISDFLEKLNHPVMSVSYKEVEEFAPPGGFCPANSGLVLQCFGRATC